MKNRSQIGRFGSSETRGTRFFFSSNGIVPDDSFGWLDISLPPFRAGSRLLADQVDTAAPLC